MNQKSNYLWQVSEPNVDCCHMTPALGSCLRTDLVLKVLMMIGLRPTGADPVWVCC